MKNNFKAIGCLATAILIAVGNAFAAIGQLAEVPPFERAVLIIKRYEAMHKPKDWPYVGYGHRVLPDEPYERGVQLTEKEADELLIKDLEGLCAMFREFGSDSIILATLGYNVGPFRLLGNKTIPKSGLITKLEAGEDFTLDDYLSYCNVNGEPHEGLRKRRMVEYMALKEDASSAKPRPDNNQ